MERPESKKIFARWQHRLTACQAISMNYAAASNTLIGEFDTAIVKTARIKTGAALKVF